MDNCNYATMKLIEMHLNDVEESLDVDDNSRAESSGANMTSGDTDTRHIAGSVHKKRKHFGAYSVFAGQQSDIGHSQH